MEWSLEVAENVVMLERRGQQDSDMERNAQYFQAPPSTRSERSGHSISLMILPYAPAVS